MKTIFMTIKHSYYVCLFVFHGNENWENCFFILFINIFIYIFFFEWLWNMDPDIFLI